ncbi:hypothetical protein [Streptomyces sporangiiformans]|uniref:hypothetical protein n=1 Tax=Streptomyces sporangiiformans TaxID=2315329 RepID=UPI003CC80F48
MTLTTVGWVKGKEITAAGGGVPEEPGSPADCATVSVIAPGSTRRRRSLPVKYTPSVGHDACSPAKTRWIEPLAPSSPAARVHPNERGERGMADAVLRAIRA